MDEDAIIKILYKVRDGDLKDVTLDSLKPLVEDGLVYIINSDSYAHFVELKDRYDELRAEINSSRKRLDKLFRKHQGSFHRWWLGEDALKKEHQEIESLRGQTYKVLDEYIDLVEIIRREYSYGVSTIEHPKTEFDSLKHQKVLEFIAPYHELQSGDYIRITEKGVKKIGDFLKSQGIDTLYNLSMMHPFDDIF